MPQNTVIPTRRRQPLRQGWAVRGTQRRAKECSKWYLFALSYTSFVLSDKSFLFWMTCAPYAPKATARAPYIPANRTHTVPVRIFCKEMSLFNGKSFFNYIFVHFLFKLSKMRLNTNKIVSLVVKLCPIIAFDSNIYSFYLKIILFLNKIILRNRNLWKLWTISMNVRTIDLIKRVEIK